MRLFTNYQDVKPFLQLIADSSDANRSALGFLPKSVYEERALAGRLWVAADNDQYQGHLLFGGKYPDLKVLQLFVHPDYRGHGIGSKLVEGLVDFAKSRQYIAVSARVAADLPANKFWERMGFICSRRVAGGRTSNRVINIRLRYVDSSLLFEIPQKDIGEVEAISYDNAPAMRVATYALDLNVLMDLVKRRQQRYKAVCELVRAGLNHLVRIVVTDEVRCELERTSVGGDNHDPMVEILRQIPALPRVEREALANLVERLRLAVFPRRSLSRQNASQDESDLVHMATCVHHKMSGFITSEKAILRASEVLRKNFNLEILSPSDFLEPTFGSDTQSLGLTVRAPGGEIAFHQFDEVERPTIENFLGTLGLPNDETHSALHPGASGSARKRLTIFANGRLSGFASWDRPARRKAHAELFLYLDETVPNLERIVDHVLESVSRDARSMGAYGIQLCHSREQVRTREIAFSRGWRRGSNSQRGALSLFKVSLFGFVDSSGWSTFVADLRRLAQVDLNQKAPTAEEAGDVGLQIVHGSKRQPSILSLFDFETLVSPGLLLLPGRSGVIVPIQEPYAEELLGRQSPQTSFLPAPEALLRVEKAYFRSPTKLNIFMKGMPLVFYVSAGRGGKRRGPMAALCMARITSTAVLHAGEALFRYQRQGVLSGQELGKVGNKDGMVHVFTFDNVVPFPCPIGLRRLKEIDCADGANVVTARRVSHEGLKVLLREAFAAEVK